MIFKVSSSPYHSMILNEAAFSEKVALGWIWEACEIPALGLSHLSMYLPITGSRCFFFFHACPVVFSEPARVVEVGAAESPARRLSKSLSILTLIHITVLSESSCERGLPRYEGASGSAWASRPGKVRAGGGVFPLHPLCHTAEDCDVRSQQ